MVDATEAPDAVVKNVLHSELRAQLVAEIAEHGFSAVGEPPIEERGDGSISLITIDPVVISFSVNIASDLAFAIAARAAHLIARWRRKHKQRESPAATQVKVIYGPRNEVLAEVDIPNYAETDL